MTAIIAAPPGRVLRAFFDADALGAWWQVGASVTTPRVARPVRDRMAADRISRRGARPARRRVPRDGHAVSRRARDSSSPTPSGCRPTANRSARWRSRSAAADSAGVTRVRVTQTGFEESARWRRYYEVIGLGWSRALTSLKSLLEH